MFSKLAYQTNTLSMRSKDLDDYGVKRFLLIQSSESSVEVCIPVYEMRS